MKKSILFTSLLIAGIYGQAQSPDWVKFPAPANYQNYDDKDVAVGVDGQGNVYTASSVIDTVNNIYQAMLVKHNSAGVQQWIKFYNANNANYDTYVRAIQVDQNGNSYVCGYGYHNATTTKDIMALKYDNAGNQLWANYWDGGQQDADYATCATLDASGNLLVGGYADVTSNTDNDMAVLKWSPSGTLLWSYTYNNTPVSGEDRVLSIATDKRRNVYISGSSSGSVSRDMISMKLDSTGANKWINRKHGTSSQDNRAYSIAVDTAGNSYITGDGDEWTTIKYSPTGNMLWTTTYTDNAFALYDLKKVAVDKHNQVVIAGDAFVSGNSTDLIVASLDPITGLQGWSVAYNYGGGDKFMDMVVDTAGNIYMGGNFNGTSNRDISATILQASGTTIFGTTYSNPYNTTSAGNDDVYQVVVDKDRNFILAGLAFTRPDSESDTDPVDVMVLKFSALVTGLNEQKLNEFAVKLFPNPCKGQVTLSISDPALIGALLTVRNLTGQTVHQEKISAQEQTANLSQLAQGIYLVTLSQNNASVTKKLVVE